MNRPRVLRIRVPCTTANLGSGFDALGLALGGLAVTVSAVPGGKGLRIESLSGEGENDLPRDDDNRIVRAAHAALAHAGVDAKTLGASLEIHSDIPLSRGLGSSAAAAVAGAMLADALLEHKLGPDGVLHVSATLEGHPDNVAPALWGGLVVSVKSDTGLSLCPVALPIRPRAALFIPDAALATSAARAVLPKSVSFADAIFNLSRSALTVAALSQGKLDILAESMKDRLHQPARSQLLPWLPRLIRAAEEAGAYGAALSGAGSTVCALVSAEKARTVETALAKAAREAGVPGRAMVLDVGPGASVAWTDVRG
ncbi:MAG: homoserine kinase [Myxococcaceae bacterium]